jgi:Ca2+-binding RTX toxin-like protein
MGLATASPSDAILGVGAAVTLTTTFGEAVTVSGMTTLTLNNGGTATYAAGSGTDALNFNYIVSGGQDISDLAVTGANLNGATVTDLAGNTADLSKATINPAGWLQIAPSGIAALDTSTQQPIAVAASHYSGPVAGLQGEYINITSDNLNITASTPNWFIHSGSGFDAIAASSGNNVLDGGTGSNFLVGGSGSDTFFVDNRGASADTWSTIVNFHSGDAVTIWGVTPDDFNFGFADSQGAAGYTGLTLHATAPGAPTASVTFAGFTSTDLASGRISASFGTESASGSTYTYFHCNS